MGSMNNNNWLGFSLSAQQLQDQSQNSSHHHHHHLGFSSDEQNESSSCFDLTSADSPIIPSLNLPPPFGILEAFNTNTTHSQDWNNMKDVGMMNSLSSSCNNEERPKLENFLGVGGHTFADQLQEHKNKLCNYNHLNNGYDHNTSTYTTMYQQTSTDHHHHHEQAQAQAQHPNNDINVGAGNNSSTIGLSMIKNWLRNNPSAPAPLDNKVAGPPPPAASQTLSLSMSTGSQSSSTLPLLNANATTESCTSDGKLDAQTGGAIESVPRKSIDTFGQRTSIYRGVTRHRWTGRYEAHLWDNSCRREGQTRKGRQVYLGGYDKEDKAARSYDLAALKYWGTTTTTNFPIGNYEKEIEEMKHMTRQEFIASLRRKSSGFSRGASIYRGVTRHHQHGRWQARIGRVAGNKDLYLGTFSTQEEAAEAYDIAAIKFRGLNAVTNFEINRYDVKSILESSTLPIGGAAKRLKEAENAETMALDLHRANEGNLNLMNGYGISGNSNTHNWPTIAFQQSQPLNLYPYAHQRLWCKQEQDNADVMGHGFGEINHQLQLGSTQNFLPTSFMHNMTSVDYSTVEQSSASNAAVYGTDNASGDHHGNGITSNGGGSFMVPMMGTVVVEDGNNQNQANGYEGMFGSSNDAYQQARNLYYQSHQQQSSSPSSSSGLAKASLYDHEGSNNCNNWIPTAVPTIAARSNYNVPVCNGASTFTVWNDT